MALERWLDSQEPLLATDPAAQARALLALAGVLAHVLALRAQRTGETAATVSIMTAVLLPSMVEGRIALLREADED